jgi:hypothetical protein
MIEMSLLVAAGLLIVFSRLSWKLRIKMLSHPLAVDIAVFALLTVLHWGTFSGVMIASISAFFCSCLLTFGRRAFGYYVGGAYKHGWLNMEHKLK